MTPAIVEAFIYGCLAGLVLGIIIGAAFMHAQYAQAVNEYTLQALEDMRKQWHP